MLVMTKKQILKAIQEGRVTAEIIGGNSKNILEKQMINILLKNIEYVAIDGKEYGKNDIDWMKIIPNDERKFVSRSIELHNLIEEKYKSLYRTLYTNFDESIADSLKKTIEEIVKYEKEKCLLERE